MSIFKSKNTLTSPGTVNVTSHNQSGGITAHTVNMHAPVQRTVTPGFIAEVGKHFPKDTAFTVVALMGDQEALIYAEEALQKLKEAGFNVNGVDQALFTTPQIGVIVNTDNSTGARELVIGARPAV